MPLTRISLRTGKSDEYRRAIVEAIYESLRAVYDTPENDRFMTIHEFDAANFDYGANYLAISRSDDLVMIEITASATRGMGQKKALFAAIAKRLAENPGLRPEDIFINLVEVARENWSFGFGLAQYA